MNAHFAYYNEIDPHAAEWLRRLISAGHIAFGFVDQRSIADVAPADLDGFTQCHFFAGVGIWSHALRSAGWGDDQPVWTGSCPCQPFSAAGAGAGFDDERHLWPHLHWLVQQCRPETIFGEQVASRDGLGWLDLVSSDLEASDYALGAVDTCAAGFGAFHIRQRLFFAAQNLRLTAGGLADAKAGGWDKWPGFCDQRPWGGRAEPADRGAIGRVADGTSIGCREECQDSCGDGTRDRAQGRPTGLVPSGADQRLADAQGGNGRLSAGQDRREVPELVGDGKGGRMADTERRSPERHRYEVAGATRTHQGGENKRQRIRDDLGHGCAIGGPRAADLRWADADWLFCRDGKWRPVEPGTFPLAHGAAARMGRLRAYGNGLDARQATAFVAAYIDRAILDADAGPAGDLFEWGVA
ncbi:MAG: DNA cytosine methyltransferase [Pseudomonadota bacterium]